MARMTPLRRRLIDDMTVRNLSPATQQSYVYAVAKFSRFFGRSPEQLGIEEVRAYQIHLVGLRLSWSHINQVSCALRFFFGVTLGRQDAIAHIVRAKEPKKLPVVLSGEEIVRFLEAVPGLRSRAALTTAYGAGLRVSEVAALKIGDLDSGRMLIRVEPGKGGKDRYVMLSPQLLTILRIYWRLAKPAHWLFPGRDAGRPVSTATLQAACRVAVREAGLAKPVTVHTLRNTASLPDPPARGGHRHSHHPGPARPQPAGDHRDLHPRRHERHRRHAQPARPSVPARGRAAGLSARMRSALEVAEVFRRHGAAYRQAHAGHLSQCQRRVMAAIEACRTAALGGHVEQCDDCGQVRIAYNSCRNRHCPKCQGLARAEWLADRQAELLPVPYFHVVFTVPAPMAKSG